MPTADTADMDRLLEATARSEAGHFWFHGFRRFVRPLVARALRGVDAPAILDCGCGTGANVEWLEPYGRTFGFDYTFSGVAYGVRHGRPRLAQATAAQIPFPDRCFDLVTAFDVLTVLPDAVERDAIAELRRVLKPGGALIVNVAALAILRGHHATLGGEQRRYTRASLRDRLVAGRFRVERLTYTNFTIFPLMLAVRLRQRLEGLRPEDDMRLPPAPLNAALAALLALEAQALRLVPMPIGSSVLALARRLDD